MSWDYKNKILFIYRYGAWCGSATRQSSEILVSVYSAQHISFNLLALENHTLLLGLNVFFFFFILYSILSIFGATAFSIYCNKATRGAFVQNFFTFENFQRHFFLDQFKPFFIFLRISSKFSIRFCKLIESKTSSAYIFKNFKSWLVYYNYIAKIFYCGDLLPKSAMPKFAYIFCALLCSVGRWFHQGHKNVLMLFS